MESFFYLLSILDTFIWYIGLATILLTGIYLTFKSKGYQFQVLYKSKKNIHDLIKSSHRDHPGVHPIKLYFASIGGMIGLGSLVWVMTAITIGGPGALFWMWVASFLGMLVKYCEIYLGIKHRVHHSHHGGGYDGGPMYYLQAAFRKTFLGKLMPIFICILLCIYGAEVSQFVMITDTLVSTFEIDRIIAIAALLFLLMLTTITGIKSFTTVCITLMPIFVISYICIGCWIIAVNFDQIPSVFYNIIHSAFNGHAAIGGFGGSTMLMAARYGVARAVYAGDIGIGYDSIVQSETRTHHPEKQARMAVFGMLSNTLIYTMTVIITMITGVWSWADLQPTDYVAKALAIYLPENYVAIYIASLFFIAGFTTLAGYLVVGQKCARFLYQKHGSKLYILYSFAAFSFFSFFSQEKAILFMSVCGGLLMIINVAGVLKLSKSVKFG